MIACVAIALLATTAREAAAQSAALGSGRIEMSAGAAWLSSQAFGSADANETTSANAPFRLFSTSSELGSAAGLDARVGVRLAGTLVVEADASYARPELRITTSSDAESATGLTAAERLQQYMIGGGATWYVPTASRVAPFVAGGAGYLRQLHDRALLVQTGRYYRFGGGVVYLLSSQSTGTLKATGIRVDLRATTFKDGVALDGDTHVAAAVAGSFLVRF
ncbi:MAG TPA: hypothetical protein VKE96_32175 [Vicinamibacterales bacterium]|nr:hypothetical protein [Vicinamibacterales bacterium]